ncbi:MAG: hypothetical protein IJX63_11230 [Lachnospiraceae bacterium]|nr:hypothetical protein [Lachnospiraceae bacterium]
MKELYTNILYDMHDIIVKNWKAILEEQAAEYKKEVPNHKHFEIYVENYEQLAQEALKRYEVEGQGVLTVYDVVMAQIQK